MAKITLSEQFIRVLKFLLATLDPRILFLLVLRGFNNEARREGWDLFLKAGGREADLRDCGLSSNRVEELLDQLNAWENVWFDVADAALGRLHPEVRERLFHKLGKTSGNEVVFTVSTMLDRLDALEQDGLEKPLALLASRGLTPDVRAKAREWLHELTSGEIPLSTMPDAAAEEERQQAQAAMWKWYLDWSKTARTIIKRKDLRIKMGISSPTSHDAEDDEDPTVTPLPGPSVAPVPPVPVPPAWDDGGPEAR